jgi:hypothetical protein
MAEEENCNCEHEHEDEKSMFAEHESVELRNNRKEKYHVICTYLNKAVNNDLFEAKVAHIDAPSLTTRYVVKASNAREAIMQALELDRYRKMEVLTGFFKILSKSNLEQTDAPVNFNWETVSDFREFLIGEEVFHKFYMAEPTAIQCVLADNEELMQNAAMSTTVEYMDHMGENLAKDVEEWLGKRDDSEE